MTSPLADLDELILECRDEKAKRYIQEAVSCYKASAFRSSIVSTWIAVVFDIIDKIKELALAGDKEAQHQLNQFEKCRANNEITNALKFERDILKVARDKLEMISNIEYLDLERLQIDRNRCAHPSMTIEGDIFNPSAELARVHIRSAVTSLLQHPPAQGKHAFERLITIISSEYFPEEPELAKKALQHSPLKKPRDSLVRNFVIVLLKKLINEDMSDYKEFRQVSAALKATAEMHKSLYDATLDKNLSDLLMALKDEELNRIIPLLDIFPEFWEYLRGDIQQKIQAFVEDLPSKNITSIATFLDFPPLQKQASIRLMKTTMKELEDAHFFVLHTKVAERIVNEYIRSRSYELANEWAKIILLYSYDLTPELTKKLICEASKNPQIIGSYEFGSVISALRSRKKIASEEFELLLEENNLGKYSLTEAPEPE